MCSWLTARKHHSRHSHPQLHTIAIQYQSQSFKYSAYVRFVVVGRRCKDGGCCKLSGIENGGATVVRHWWRWPRFRVNYLLTLIQSVGSSASASSILSTIQFHRIECSSRRFRFVLPHFARRAFVSAPTCHRNTVGKMGNSTLSRWQRPRRRHIDRPPVHNFSVFSFSSPNAANIAGNVCRRHLVHSSSHLQCGISSWLFLLATLFFSLSLSIYFSRFSIVLFVNVAELHHGDAALALRS